MTILVIFKVFLAEAKGFEPSRPFGPHDFESCAFNHSATLPRLILPDFLPKHKFTCYTYTSYG